MAVYDGHPGGRSPIILATFGTIDTGVRTARDVGGTAWHYGSDGTVRLRWSHATDLLDPTRFDVPWAFDHGAVAINDLAVAGDELSFVVPQEVVGTGRGVLELSPVINVDYQNTETCNGAYGCMFLIAPRYVHEVTINP